MKPVFADTFFYLALANSQDEYHTAAYDYTGKLRGSFVTTAWVITEVANSLCRTANRTLFLSLLEDLRGDRNVQIIPPSQDLFTRGLDLYAQRADKDWSLWWP